nr:MAG TPA: hypothetical protein [Caudoviricetes sp.]
MAFVIIWKKALIKLRALNLYFIFQVCIIKRNSLKKPFLKCGLFIRV